MKKQYINASNRAPGMALGFPWMLGLTAHIFNWPGWVWGVIGTLTVFLVFNFFYRLTTEEGIDVVRRDG